MLNGMTFRQQRKIESSWAATSDSIACRRALRVPGVGRDQTKHLHQSAAAPEGEPLYRIPLPLLPFQVRAYHCEPRTGCRLGHTVTRSITRLAIFRMRKRSITKTLM